MNIHISVVISIVLCLGLAWDDALPSEAYIFYLAYRANWEAVKPRGNVKKNPRLLRIGTGIGTETGPSPMSHFLAVTMEFDAASKPSGLVNLGENPTLAEVQAEFKKSGWMAGRWKLNKIVPSMAGARYGDVAIKVTDSLARDIKLLQQRPDGLPEQILKAAASTPEALRVATDVRKAETADFKLNYLQNKLLFLYAKKKVTYYIGDSKHTYVDFDEEKAVQRAMEPSHVDRIKACVTTWVDGMVPNTPAVVRNHLDLINAFEGKCKDNVAKVAACTKFLH